jgi:GTP-binding protein Era
MADAPVHVPQRCGFVALIGAPNAGKSTLLNKMVGGKVAIVTHKVQTTRARLRGIASEGESQIIFVDTPGIFQPRRKLDEAMVEAAWSGASDADVTALLVDARVGHSEEVAEILQKLKRLATPCVLVLNKTDVAERIALLELAEALNDEVAFEQTFMISAETGDGVADVKLYLANRMPTGLWLYPADQMADVPLRQMAAEITREKVFLRLHEELPYASTVETEQWKELRDGSVRIEQVLFVERESQRKIALGKGGQTIKAIGKAAREELQLLLETKVHLFLFVKVREKWGQDPERFEQIGLDFPKP